MEGKNNPLNKHRSSESRNVSLFMIRNGRAMKTVSLITRIFAFKREYLNVLSYKVLDLNQ